MQLALAGDTMLGRGVAEAIAGRGPLSLFSEEVKEITRGADLFLLNLECCISDRGERWPDPTKPFFFRAPPAAVDTLADLGVDCVTLANNHALDYGPQALVDTVDQLEEAGIAVVGAGPTVERARRPAVLQHEGFRLAVVGLTDHPRDFAAGPEPGVAFADLRSGAVAAWVLEQVADLADHTDGVLVTPHWGPNMVSSPLSYIRSSAAALRAAGATLVAGHSAHVFQGVDANVLYDLGDFVDDYAVDPQLRNDLGLLWLLEIDPNGLRRIEAVPLALDFCFTRTATAAESAGITDRLSAACAPFGTSVTDTASARLEIAPGGIDS